MSTINYVGNTPLLKIGRVTKGVPINIRAKAEHMNPGGSIKDRIALYIIREAEEAGELSERSIILEVSSGNTGIALSMIGAALGYKVRIMLPESVSVERRKMILCYGAELELLDSLLDMETASNLSEERAKSEHNIFLPRQFKNPHNTECHYQTTGLEILEQHPGRIDAFVMGVGTGGTLMGVGRRLREEYKDVQIVAVEPEESAVMSGGSPGCHGIQGLADGFIPELVNLNEVDDVVTVSTEEATQMARLLSYHEGLLVGISSGANIVASIKIANTLGTDSNIVTVLPDRGERYISCWYNGEKDHIHHDTYQACCP